MLVTSRSFGGGRLDLTGELERAGCRVEFGAADHALEKLAGPLGRAAAWICGTGPVTAGHLDAAPDLRLIARYGTGTDNVDLQAAAERRVLVTNTPGANTEAVADHTLALMLASLRGIGAGVRPLRSSPRQALRARELGSLTVGLVGFGRVARAVVRRLRGFGSVVLAYDPFVDESTFASCGVRRSADLQDLGQACDLISLHLPGDDVVVDHRFLEQVRPGTTLINTARAALVDEAAVAEALRSGRLGGYASDVLTGELTDAPRRNPLLAEDLAGLTVFTPHTAAQTVEAIDRMGRGTVDAVLALLNGDQPQHRIELPEVVR